MEEFGYHWRDFYEILNLSIFRKSVGKIRVSHNEKYFRKKMQRKSKHTFYAQ